jgi:cobalt/nickel transport system permease protein
VTAEVDRFAHLDSPLHRWDPRWKLATLILLMLAIGLERPGAREDPSWARDVPPAAASLLVALTIAAASSLPAPFVLGKLAALSWLLGTVFVIFALAYPGPRLDVGFLSVSRKGCIFALLIALRASAIVLLGITAFGTARFDISVKALRRLHMPGPLVQILLFTYRYTFVYADQLRRMQTGMRARGFRPRRDLRTLRALGNAVGVLLVGSTERTQRVQGAMKCRGFAGTYRTAEEFRTRGADVALSAGLLGVAGGLAAWRVL